MSGQWLGVWALGLLAYLPALFAAPGKMPSDTKLYLYLDPGRLIADARTRGTTASSPAGCRTRPSRTFSHRGRGTGCSTCCACRTGSPIACGSPHSCSSAVSVCAGRPSTSVSVLPAH
jgi:hypothetical protein